MKSNKIKQKQTGISQNKQTKEKRAKEKEQETHIFKTESHHAAWLTWISLCRLGYPQTCRDSPSLRKKRFTLSYGSRKLVYNGS